MLLCATVLRNCGGMCGYVHGFLRNMCPFCVRRDVVRKGFTGMDRSYRYVRGSQGIVMVCVAICKGFKEILFDFCLSSRCVHGF